MEYREDEFTDALIEHFENMEELNRLLGYYQSCVDLLESISERTQEENIKLQFYKIFILDLERLIRVFNYEKRDS